MVTHLIWSTNILLLFSTFLVTSYQYALLVEAEVDEARKKPTDASRAYRLVVNNVHVHLTQLLEDFSSAPESTDERKKIKAHPIIKKIEFNNLFKP